VTSPATCDVSIVVPAYERTESLRRAILSLFALDYPKDRYQVVVVDSSSTAGNEMLLRELESVAPCAFRWRRKAPEGPGPSRNAGVGLSQAPIVAFMDSDCVADSGWLYAGLAAFEPGVGLVQGRTRPDPRGTPGVLTWCPTTERETFVYECTSIFYRREAFDAVGGFEADQHPTALKVLGGEDVTLAWSVKRAGWQSRFAPDAVVFHEIVPLTLWGWLFEKRLLLWPSLVRRFPELRRFLVARVFWDRAQAYLVLALAGLALTAVSPAALLLGAPYLLHRGLPPSRSFPGLLRPFRVLPYLARDTMFFLLLLAGSIRHRTVLL
jgi:glycosyltransferase involved in cell wall biosynthesis